MTTTKTMEIKTFKSVGEIVFGEDRESIRAKLGGSFKTFKPTKTSTNTVDDFGWCHVHYDTKDKAEGVEFFNDNTVALSLDGANLFALGFAALAQTLREKDSEIEFSPPDIICKKMGISAYGEGGKTETIMVSKKGYLK